MGPVTHSVLHQLVVYGSGGWDLSHTQSYLSWWCTGLGDGTCHTLSPTSVGGVWVWGMGPVTHSVLHQLVVYRSGGWDLSHTQSYISWWCMGLGDGTCHTLSPTSVGGVQVWGMGPVTHSVLHQLVVYGSGGWDLSHTQSYISWWCMGLGDGICPTLSPTSVGGVQVWGMGPVTHSVLHQLVVYGSGGWDLSHTQSYISWWCTGLGDGTCHILSPTSVGGVYRSGGWDLSHTQSYISWWCTGLGDGTCHTLSPTSVGGVWVWGMGPVTHSVLHQLVVYRSGGWDLSHTQSYISWWCTGLGDGTCHTLSPTSVGGVRVWGMGPVTHSVLHQLVVYGSGGWDLSHTQSYISWWCTGLGDGTCHTLSPTSVGGVWVWGMGPVTHSVLHQLVVYGSGGWDLIHTQSYISWWCVQVWGMGPVTHSVLHQLVVYRSGGWDLSHTQSYISWWCTGLGDGTCHILSPTSVGGVYRSGGWDLSHTQSYISWWCTGLGDGTCHTLSPTSVGGVRVWGMGPVTHSVLHQLVVCTGLGDGTCHTLSPTSVGGVQVWGMGPVTHSVLHQLVVYRSGGWDLSHTKSYISWWCTCLGDWDLSHTKSYISWWCTGLGDGTCHTLSPTSVGGVQVWGMGPVTHSVLHQLVVYRSGGWDLSRTQSYISWWCTGLGDGTCHTLSPTSVGGVWVWGMGPVTHSVLHQLVVYRSGGWDLSHTQSYISWWCTGLGDGTCHTLSPTSVGGVWVWGMGPVTHSVLHQLVVYRSGGWDLSHTQSYISWWCTGLGDGTCHTLSPTSVGGVQVWGMGPVTHSVLHQLVVYGSGGWDLSHTQSYISWWCTGLGDGTCHTLSPTSVGGVQVWGMGPVTHSVLHQLVVYRSGGWDLSHTQSYISWWCTGLGDGTCHTLSPTSVGGVWVWGMGPVIHSVLHQLVVYGSGGWDLSHTQSYISWWCVQVWGMGPVTHSVLHQLVVYRSGGWDLSHTQSYISWWCTGLGDGTCHTLSPTSVGGVWVWGMGPVIHSVLHQLVVYGSGGWDLSHTQSYISWWCTGLGDGTCHTLSPTSVGGVRVWGMGPVIHSVLHQLVVYRSGGWDLSYTQSYISWWCMGLGDGTCHTLSPTSVGGVQVWGMGPVTHSVLHQLVVCTGLGDGTCHTLSPTSVGGVQVRGMGPVTHSVLHQLVVYGSGGWDLSDTQSYISWWCVQVWRMGPVPHSVLHQLVVYGSGGWDLSHTQSYISWWCVQVWGMGPVTHSVLHQLVVCTGLGDGTCHTLSPTSVGGVWVWGMGPVTHSVLHQLVVYRSGGWDLSHTQSYISWWCMGLGDGTCHTSRSGASVSKKGITLSCPLKIIKYTYTFLNM